MGNEGIVALATVLGCIMGLIQEDQERLFLLYILDTMTSVIKSNILKQKFTYSHILATHFQYEKRDGAFWEQGICSAYD